MLTIHGVPVSVHTRKVIVAALHKGLAFEVNPVVPLGPVCRRTGASSARPARSRC